MTSFDRWLARKPCRSWAELAAREQEPFPLLSSRVVLKNKRPPTLLGLPAPRQVNVSRPATPAVYVEGSRAGR